MQPHILESIKSSMAPARDCTLPTMPIHDLWRFTGPDGVGYIRRRVVYALQSPGIRFDAPWIIKLEEDKYRQFHLIHPLSESEDINPIITLPETFPKTSFQFTNSSRVKELGKEYILQYEDPATDMPMKKFAVLEGKGRDEFTVLAIDKSGKLAMYMSDSGGKWVFGNGHDQYDDVVLSGNKFYVVDAAGKMDVVVVGGDDDDDDGVKVSQVAKSFGGGNNKFLVDSDGTLHLVDMTVDYKISPDWQPGLSHYEWRCYDDEFDYFRRTLNIKVFRLDLKTGQWIKLDTLGDKMLFLGDNCKFAASAKDIFGDDDYCAVNGGCIVFTDRPSNPYVGIFNLKSRTINGSIASMVRYSKRTPHSRMFWPPPRWVKSAASIHELILPSDDESYLLSMVDGLTPDQRKILLYFFKTNLGAQTEFSRLLNYVTEHLAYHHGELSLAGTIIGMAQIYAGTNNINFLRVPGSFCLRWQAGIDDGAVQHISTWLCPVARLLFPKDDDSQLEYLTEDEKPIEPAWYVPIIPTVLVNGVKGIETRGSSFVPNYNMRHIIWNVRKLLKHEKMCPMFPSYSGFRGKVKLTQTKDDGNIYTVTGKIKILDRVTVEITELPIGWGLQDYLEFLHSVCAKDRKGKIRKEKHPFIEDFCDYSGGYTVHILVFLKEHILTFFGKKGLMRKLKLISTISTCKMHLRDSEGKFKKYNTPEEILEEFFHYRYNIYERRKDAMLANLEAELKRCKCKIKIASQVLAGNEIDVTDREQYTLILGREQYTLLLGLIAEDVIPFSKKNCMEEAVAVAGATDDTEETKENTGHLLSHPVQSCGKKLSELQAERNKLEQEIETLKKEKAVETLWTKELDALESELDALDSELDKLEKRKRMKRKRMYDKVKFAGEAAKNESAAEPMYVSGDDTVTEADIVPEAEKAKGRAPVKKKVPAKKAAAASARDRIAAGNLDSSDHTEDADVAPEQNKEKESVKRTAAAKRGRTELCDDEDDIENLRRPAKHHKTESLLDI